MTDKEILLAGTFAYDAKKLYEQGNLICGEYVLCIPEPNNIHDNKAIVVLLKKTNDKIGYIPKEISKTLFSKINDCTGLQATISSVAKDTSGRTAIKVGILLPIEAISKDNFSLRKGDFEGAGVYEIVNLMNNKKYVGQSADLEKRWMQHQRELSYGTHHSKTLQEDWNSYGAENFSFRCIRYEKDEGRRREIEDSIILKEKLLTRGYNRVNKEIVNQVLASEAIIEKARLDFTNFDPAAQKAWEELRDKSLPVLEREREALLQKKFKSKVILGSIGLVGMAYIFFGPIGLIAGLPVWCIAGSAIQTHSKMLGDVEDKICALKNSEPKLRAEQNARHTIDRERSEIKRIVRKHYKS